MHPHKPTKKRTGQNPKKQASTKQPQTSLRAFYNESLSQDQPSQLSQTPLQPPSTPQNQQQLQSNPIYKYHKESLYLKHKILRTIMYSFYPIQIANLLSYICHQIYNKYLNQIGWSVVNNQIFRDHQYKIEEELEKVLTVNKDQLYKRFYDAEDYLKILRDAKYVVDRDDDANQVKINSKYFNMLNNICDDMLLKIVQQKQKQNPNDQQIHCKKCNKLRQLYEIQAKNSCQCGSYQTIKRDKTHSTRKLNQAKALQQIIKLIQKLKQQLDQLRNKEIQRIKQLRNKNNENNRITDADKDVVKAVEYVEKEGNTIGYVSPWEKYPVRKNGVQLKNAEKEYQPRRVYPKIEELRMLGETRKRRKIQIADSMPDSL